MSRPGCQGQKGKEGPLLLAQEVDRCLAGRPHPEAPEERQLRDCHGDFAPEGASLTELTPISRRIQRCFPAFPLLSRRDQRADPEAGVKKSWRGGARGGCEQRQEI